MPIPTRRLSLREPRTTQRQKPDPEPTIPEVEQRQQQQPRSIKARSNTTSLPTTASRNQSTTSGLPQPAATTVTNTGGRGVATTATAAGVGSDSNNNGGDATSHAARRRSFLPQRGSWQRTGVTAGVGTGGATRLQLQPQDSQLQRLRDAKAQEESSKAPAASQSPVLSARPAEPVEEGTVAAKLPDLSQQELPPLSPTKISRPVTSPTHSHASSMATSRLERSGSVSARNADVLRAQDGPVRRLERSGSIRGSKVDALKSQEGSAGRFERPGSSENTPRLDSLRSEDGGAGRSERPGSSSTTSSSQLSRRQSVHTTATRTERPGSASTTNSQASRPQSKPTQRAERPGSGGAPKPEAPKVQKAGATRLERSASLRQPPASRLTAAAKHSRHQSQGVVVAKGLTSVKQGEGDASSNPSLRASKPQFSTLQQHYSPKKGPKTKQPVPTTSTASSTTTTKTEPGTDPASPSHTDPYIAALQTELLQLHLLHANSLQARRDWESSAEQKLRKQHKAVMSKYHALLAREEAAQRYVNNLALNKLAEDAKMHNKGNKSSYDFSDQIQVLSRVVQDVAALTDARGGRYSSCVRVFEEWFAHVSQVRQERSRMRKSAVGSGGGDDGGDDDGSGSGSNCDFIDPLNSKWKEEVVALGAKLELCARELDCLDVDARVDGIGEGGNGYPTSSALVRTVRGHKMLLASMIGELEVMSAVEADVGVLERLWVKGAVDRLSSGEGGGGGGNGLVEMGGRQPAWVSV
ncbi:hypothetical protein AJ79_02051 [Helicocarpus griseus UAMH5409]|uniref:Uncharacterized protein n=1 Tax=Helicocarpus griseus UAMH5409 TaxID=1447875 RepID=A0A2B7Y4Y3_9EURO|nr:hypothetical protein AJ79_02051 [Helicocarpus griseus UAMH5409]